MAANDLCIFILIGYLAISQGFVIPVEVFQRVRDNDLPHPLIMIPGDGGCQAYAQFKDFKTDPFQIWVDLRYLISPRTFGDYFK